MRRSRSSNFQPSFSPRARPTLLLPAPKNPIRSTARAPRRCPASAAMPPCGPDLGFFAGPLGRDVGESLLRRSAFGRPAFCRSTFSRSVLRKSALRKSVFRKSVFRRSDLLFALVIALFFGAFSEVDFTTEGAQHYGRGHCHFAHGTCKGTALIEREVVVSLGLKRDVVVNLAPYRARAHVSRCPLRDRGVDISAMAGEAILPAFAEVADVGNSPAGRNHLHYRAIHTPQHDLSP